MSWVSARTPGMAMHEVLATRAAPAPTKTASGHACTTDASNRSRQGAKVGEVAQTSGCGRCSGSEPGDARDILGSRPAPAFLAASTQHRG